MHWSFKIAIECCCCCATKLMSLTDERKNYDELTNLATKESASWKPSSFFVIIKWHSLTKALSFWWSYKFKKICESLVRLCYFQSCNTSFKSCWVMAWHSRRNFIFILHPLIKHNFKRSVIIIINWIAFSKKDNEYFMMVEGMCIMYYNLRSVSK